MKFLEFGTEHRDVILLLHGGGLSWWNYREAAQQLQARYRVILPILDGHGGSDRGFTSIEDNAAEIIDFIDRQLGGSVLLLGGLSLGGQIALEILSQRGDICRCAMIESALVVPSKLTCAMIGPAFGSCYGLIRRRWFARLQFRSLRLKEELFEDYFRDTCRIGKADMIAFLKANALYELKGSFGDGTAKVCVLVGARERAVMRRSAEKIHGARKGSTLEVLPALYHGEYSINRAADYADKIRELLHG